MMPKYTIVAAIGIICLLPLALADPPQHAIHAHECLKELEILPYDLTTMTIAQLKCIAKCRFEKAGVMDESGAVNPDVVMPYLNPQRNPEKAANLSKCFAMQHTDLCEKAYLIIDCIFDVHSTVKTTKIVPNLEQCAKEFNVTLPFADRHDRNVQCAVACLAERMKWMNADGVIDKVVTMGDLGFEGNDEEAKKCFDLHENDKCEKMTTINKCLMKLGLERMKKMDEHLAKVA